MKPVDFPEATTVFAKDQPEYQPLPAHVVDDEFGEVTSCWHMDWRERLRVLFSGNVYVAQLTFRRPLTPLRVSTEFLK